MEPIYKPTIVGRILAIGLLAAAGIILSGPLVAGLIFSALGTAVWFVLRTITVGKPQAWEEIRSTGRMLWSKASTGFNWLSVKLDIGASWAKREVLPRAKHAGHVAKVRVGSNARYFGGIFFESACGGLVCAMLAALAWTDTGFEAAVPVAALAGAALGAWVGVSRRQSAARTKTVSG